MLAERLHLSGIITMVVFAMAASRRAPEIMPARIRIPSWAVWEVAVFVLNVLAFILVGFQLKSIAARATGATGARYAAVAAAVCVAVILARIVWVTGAAAFSRWRCRPRADGTPGPRDAVGSHRPRGRGGRLVRHARHRDARRGARAPTERGAPFPYRDLILVTAFGVVLGTLVLQGLTLRPLLLRLRLEDDGTVEREVRLARVETLRAAVAAGRERPGAESAELVRQRYELQLRRAEEELRTIARREAAPGDGAIDGPGGGRRASCAPRPRRSGGAWWRSAPTARSATPRSSASRRSSTGRARLGAAVTGDARNGRVSGGGSA